MKDELVTRARRETPSNSDPLANIEWTRTTVVEKHYGISRATLYALGSRGEILLSRHTRPGAKQGFVLVNVPSVRAYLGRGVVVKVSSPGN